MEKEKLTLWLDKQAELYRELRTNQSLLDENEEEYACLLSVNIEGVHITHAKRIANLLEIPFTKSARNDDDYPIQISFTHNGVSFYSIYTEEEFERE